MRRGGGLGGGVEIVAERRAERGLVALGDGDLLQHRRPKPAGTRLQQLFERADFGFQPLRAPLGGLERRPRGGLGLARRAYGRLRALRAATSAASRFFVGHFQRFCEPRQFLRAAALAGDQREFGLDAGEFRLEAGDGGRFSSRDRGFQRVAAGVHAGELLLRVAKRRLGRVQRRLDLGETVSRASRSRSCASASAPKSSPRSSSRRCVDLGRVLDQRPFAFEIAG